MTEDITYTDGSSQVDVHYAIQNISGAPTSIRAGALADLFVGNNDNGNGVISNVAPRFVGGRDEATGLVYGLQEITPWAALQEGDFEFVFDNFSADGLNNTVDSAAPDNGVGVELRLDNIAPGEVRGIDVRWLLAAPGAARHRLAAARRPTVPQGGVLPAARGRQDRQRRRPPGPGLLPDPAEPSVRRAQGRQAAPGRRDLRHHRGPREPDRPRTAGRHRSSRGSTTASSRSPRPGREPITNLTMAEPQAAAARAARGRPPRPPRRRSRASCGARAAATSAPPASSARRPSAARSWLVIDRCGGTVTRVTEGTVAVRDFVKRKTRAGAGRQEVRGAQAQVSWVSVSRRLPGRPHGGRLPAADRLAGAPQALRAGR